MSFNIFSLKIICPTSYNLAEFLVSQLNVTDEPESQKKIQWICSKYVESEAGKENEKKLEKLKNRKKQNGIIGVSNGVPHYGEVSYLCSKIAKLVIKTNK